MNPKVFMIGWEFPPYNSGGLGTACAGLTAGLSRLHVQQTFVLPKKLPTNAPYLHIIHPDNPYFHQINVNLELLPYGQIIHKRNAQYKHFHKPMPRHNYYTEMANQALDYADMIRSLITEERFNILHGHDWMTYPAAVQAKKLTKKPLILHIHATEYDRTLGGKINPEIHALENEGLHKADRIIAVSNYTKDIVSQKYDIPLDKISVVHNGITLADSYQHHIDNDKLRNFAYGKKIVIFVGRFTAQKGPDYFIEAANKIAQQDKDAVFIMAGDGDMYQQILNSSSGKHLTGKLLFTGFLRDYQKQFLYQRADLFIMPSVSEPFGLVALEAAATHTPVIISKQSGVKEVLPAAISVDFWDTAELANQALKILNNPDYANNVSQKAYQQTTQVTWLKAAQKCLNIYQNII